jgi:osmoprotectant transport system ATP-binding protein
LYSRAVIELRGVSKVYGATVALAPLDLEIERGRTTVLIGSSGCGKSTLLRLVIGLVEPDTGEVRFGGERLTRENLRGMRRRMGYVIQEGGLFPHLTARANVALMARELRWDPDRIARRTSELAELVRLSPDQLDRYPAQLSGGQRQRVSLMRALMLDPEALLLDEPLGALDPIIRAELQADLRAVVRSFEKTVVHVTHDLGEAGYFGDMVVLLRDGAIVQRGTLDEMVREPADPFVTRFVDAQRGPSA